MANKQGIVIAVPRKYEEITLSNLLSLRKMGCELPIELWEIGKEITDSTRKKLSKISEVSFKNVEDFTDNPSHWKGFQVKAFAFYHSRFQEVILCDGDVILHQNPEILFKDSNYLETGTYFFRDLDKWTFSELTNNWEQLKQKLFFNKFKSLRFFNQRKKFIRSIIPKKIDLFPQEWAYIYEEEIPNEPVKEALQESGIVAMDKLKQKRAVDCMFDLNKNHLETYQYIWGDKETFWLGCVMANSPFYFNETTGYFSQDSQLLTHNYHEKPFFSQKG